MATGIPLTDADRWDWLISLRAKNTISVERKSLKLMIKDVIRCSQHLEILQSAKGALAESIMEAMLR